jgi:hypothetical protein
MLREADRTSVTEAAKKHKVRVLGRVRPSGQQGATQMTDSELHFQLLTKELDHADKQISAYMDQQMKILGFVFAFLGTSMGLFLTVRTGDGLSPQNLASLLVLASGVGSFGVLQSVINYGIALGYMYDKECYIATRFQKLLNLNERPLFAVRAFRESPAQIPVLLSTLVIAVGVDVLNAAILWAAFHTGALGTITCILGIGAVGLLGFVVFVQVRTGRAMRTIGIASAKVG